jgi:hypothetical protein
METDFIGSAKSLDEVPIALCRTAAQSVVNMSDRNRDVHLTGQRLHQVEQDHRVHPAADGDEDPISRRKKSPVQTMAVETFL